MQIDERSVGDGMVLDVKGKVTRGEGDEMLKDKVNSMVNQGHEKIVLNLAGVPYIDSAGLGEIVRTYTTVSRQGGNLKLLSLTKRITDLLAITKLLTVFETYDNEADAVRSFSSANVQRAGVGMAPSAPSPAGSPRLSPETPRQSRSIPALLLVSLRSEQWTKNLI